MRLGGRLREVETDVQAVPLGGLQRWCEGGEVAGVRIATQLGHGSACGGIRSLNMVGVAHGNSEGKPRLTRSAHGE